MNCPKCKSNDYFKDGRAHSRQRYLCRRCKYHYIVDKRSGAESLVTKRQALELYLEGLGFRSMAGFKF